MPSLVWYGGQYKTLAPCDRILVKDITFLAPCDRILVKDITFLAPCDRILVQDITFPSPCDRKLSRIKRKWICDSSTHFSFFILMENLRRQMLISLFKVACYHASLQLVNAQPLPNLSQWQGSLRNSLTNGKRNRL